MVLNVSVLGVNKEYDNIPYRDCVPVSKQKQR